MEKEASSSAYEYCLRTPSPRRCFGGQSASPQQFGAIPRDLRNFSDSMARELTPPSLPYSGLPTGQLRTSVELRSPQPLRQVQRCEYSDRLIPSRAASHLESGMSLLLFDENVPANTSPVPGSRPRVREEERVKATYDQLLRSELLGPCFPEPARHRGTQRSREDEVLATPERRSGLFRYRRQLEDDPGPMSLSPTPLRAGKSHDTPSRKPDRKFPQKPFCVLDASQLSDEYCLSLLDYSSDDVLAFGLLSDFWITGRAGQAWRLCNLGPGTTVASVKWASRVHHKSSQGNEALAIGTSDGEVQIWDAAVGRKVRTVTGLHGRVGALAWADGASTLFTGAQDPDILRWDVRSGSWGPAARLRGYGQQVCVLDWSQDWQSLASGGNGGGVSVWSGRSSSPDVRLGEHTNNNKAAVKAVAWSPQMRGLLATGGGTADESVRLWNTLVGAQAGVVPTGSQVCNLAWSPACDGELISNHGESVVLWRHRPGGLSRLHTFLSPGRTAGTTARVLCMALSPKGQTVVTGSDNGLICFWNLLAPCKPRAKSLRTGSLNCTIR
ncbi:unnamed protein product [Polarella glacialis]|uniref:CDC20/Fizzy WD40 domain-containing protein n=1 Tax=Polarella glacialis TaxID=89957 RepID=A0A813G341_POLGL|nr:unnamed protein product [Polarella glacialis]